MGFAVREHGRPGERPKDHGFLGYRQVPSCLPFPGMPTSPRFAPTLAVTSSAWFLFALDRLAVTTALPTIRSDLGADLVGVQWTVNAYTLAFAVLLLGGAALGDRFGRRRMFTAGVATFTAASAAAALAPDVGALVAVRAVQGAGAAIFVPVSLTLLTMATPPGRRGRALGAWGGIGGLGAALGPLLGGALTALAGWQSVFWVNVPLGLALVALAGPCLDESRAAAGAGSICCRCACSGSRAFTLANAVALLFYAALFGGLFLVTQLIQVGLGAAPLDAGLRLLPMAAMPMLLAPAGGALADRFGTRPPMVLGVALVAAGAAGLAAVTAPGSAYAALVAPLLLMGAGSGLFFAPIAATQSSARCRHTSTAPPRGCRQPCASWPSSSASPCSARSSPRTATSARPPGPLPASPRRCGSPRPSLGYGHTGRTRPARSPPFPLTDRRPHRIRRGEASPHEVRGGRVVAGSITADTSHPGRRAGKPRRDPRVARRRLRPHAAHVDAAVWDGYRADLLDLDRHVRDGELYVALLDGEIVGYAAYYPDATAQGLGGCPGGRAAADSPCTRATAATASPPRSSASWSSAPASRARRSSPSTPPGSWAPHGRSTGGWATTGPGVRPRRERALRRIRRRTPLAGAGLPEADRRLSGRPRRRRPDPMDAGVVRGQDGRRRPVPERRGIGSVTPGSTRGPATTAGGPAMFGRDTAPVVLGRDTALAEVAIFMDAMEVCARRAPPRGRSRHRQDHCLAIGAGRRHRAWTPRARPSPPSRVRRTCRSSRCATCSSR